MTIADEMFRHFVKDERAKLCTALSNSAIENKHLVLNENVLHDVRQKGKQYD